MPVPHSHNLRLSLCALSALLLPACGAAQTVQRAALPQPIKTTAGKNAPVKNTPARNAATAAKPVAVRRPAGGVQPVTKIGGAGVESAERKNIGGKSATAQPSVPAFLASIVVRANSDVNGGRFTLGEIADIQSKDKALQARLSVVEIGTVSMPGQARLIGPGDITVHLRAAGLSVLLDHKQLELIAPPEMRVTRAAHTVEADEITRAAIASAQSLIANIPNATLEPAAGTGRLTVPAGRAHVVAGAYRGLPESGTITVPVSILVDGNVAQSVDVTLHIRRKMRTVVVRRTLEPHDIVSADDVTLALVDLPGGFAHPLADVQSVVGKRATRRIVIDGPVSADWLETPPDLKANTRVTIEYVFGSVHITAPGLTQQAGMIGDMIRVYAQDTHKELSVLVVNDHTVQLIEAE